MLHVGSKSIRFENKLSNKIIKTVNEKYDLRAGFDDPFKADNHGMIDWVVKRFILRVATFVLKIY